MRITKITKKIIFFSGFLLFGFTIWGQSIEIANQTSPATAVGDFNNDGCLDFLLAADQPSKDLVLVKIYIGNGKGKFPRVKTIIENIPNANQTSPILSTGDFNNDGYLDFIITATKPGTNVAYTYTYLGNGKLNFY